MRVARIVVSAALVLATAGTSYAAQLKSGIPVDGKVPKYKATKLGGGDDGVELGKPLCYT